MSKKRQEALAMMKKELSEEHFEMIQRFATSSREKKFIEVKTKLKNKFVLLYRTKYKRPFRKKEVNQTENS